MMDEDGFVLDIIHEEDAGDEIEYFPGIISPGFINCHCHLELSHLKGIIETGTGLVNFVSNVMKGRTASENDIISAISAAEKEMLDNGIVAVGDISNTAASFSQKTKQNLPLWIIIRANLG